MKPPELTAAAFAAYPPRARAIIVDHLALVRMLPLVFAALLLREAHAYDWKFPAEQRAIDDQFAFLASLAPAARASLLQGFADVHLPDEAARIDWVAHPQQFLDALTAALWSSHQIDAFRRSAMQYADHLQQARPEPAPILPRMTLVVLDSDLRQPEYPLFRKLRPHGVFVPQVDASDGWVTLAAFAQERVRKTPVPFSHLYFDGGAADDALAAHLATSSYVGLSSVRAQLLQRIGAFLASAGGGPEHLRTALARITPESLQWPSQSGDPVSSGPVFQRFQLDVLTQGSGTQIFSTTFVQWAAREALRRAQPLTLVLRFSPRQRSLNMNEMLSGKTENNTSDPAGSLLDADMGAFYAWIDQQRLTGADQSAFLVWSQAHNQAMLIGPALPRNTAAGAPMNMRQMLAQLA